LNWFLLRLPFFGKQKGEMTSYDEMGLCKKGMEMGFLLKGGVRDS
jgi:hypothetical protein